VYGFFDDSTISLASKTDMILVRTFAKRILPPILVDAGKWVMDKVSISQIPSASALPEWEYVPEGWTRQNIDREIKGWNVGSVLEMYKANWQTFVRNLEGALPFSVSPGLPTKGDCASQICMMSYAYALALSTRQKSQISMLDWGGGVGHYYLISQALVPGLKIDYHCKEVALLAEYGRQLFPRAHFYTDETCLANKYDFVLASSSLQYSQGWSSTLESLARSTTGYMLVTNMPFVRHSPSFVFVQRPYRYGYNTEYLGWCLNREEFLECAERAELKLVRELIIGHRPYIHHAPEQNEYRGYLFRSSRMDGC
jgi:putative methyltransferase (TIGR04325 family)